MSDSVYGFKKHSLMSAKTGLSSVTIRQSLSVATGQPYPKQNGLHGV